MSLFRVLFSGLVLLLVVELIAAQFLTPYATYEQVFQYSDGSISVNQTAQLKLSDKQPGGLLNVGAYVLKVKSLPPRLSYRAREVGRIPKTATMHVEEACLVADKFQADTDASVTSNSVMQAAVKAAVAKASGRRLLSEQLDAVSYEGVQFYIKNCGDMVWMQQKMNADSKFDLFYEDLRARYLKLNTTDIPPMTDLSATQYVRLVTGTHHLEDVLKDIESWTGCWAVANGKECRAYNGNRGCDQLHIVQKKLVTLPIMLHFLTYRASQSNLMSAEQLRRMTPEQRARLLRNVQPPYELLYDPEKLVVGPTRDNHYATYQLACRVEYRGAHFVADVRMADGTFTQYNFHHQTRNQRIPQKDTSCAYLVWRRVDANVH